VNSRAAPVRCASPSEVFRERNSEFVLMGADGNLELVVELERMLLHLV